MKSAALSMQVLIATEVILRVRGILPLVNVSLTNFDTPQNDNGFDRWMTPLSL